MRPRLRALPLLLALAVSACGSANAPADSGQSAGGAGFPVTIDNCGTSLTLTAAPQRIVLVNNDAIANVEAFGQVDHVVALTSTPAEGLYQPETYTAFQDLDVLSTETNTTGGSIVSHESLLATEPDLVISPENAVDRQALQAAGIAVYSPTAYCQDPPAELSERATFDRVWDELGDYGAMFGEPEKADELIAEGKATLEQPAEDRGTAAAFYVSSTGVISPYGGPSMVTPVFEAAGLTNVYADMTERVFDASVEDVVSRDPHTIVLLYSGEDADAARQAFSSVPGVDRLPALRENRVVTLPFPYTDPPTVLTVRGPQELVKRLDGK